MKSKLHNIADHAGNYAFLAIVIIVVTCCTPFIVVRDWREQRQARKALA